VYVVYTRWKNLKKTNDMVDGQVGFHRPENVRRIQVEKNNFIVNALNKTKVEKFPDLAALQQDRLREIQQEKKQHRREEEKAKKAQDLESKRAKEELSYDRIMTQDNMIRNSGKSVDFFHIITSLYNIYIVYSNAALDSNEIFELFTYLQMNPDFEATADATAAEEYEDDFF
jgi:LPS O-antigen subunit length determinant protein (WzzB/FepE family)